MAYEMALELCLSVLIAASLMDLHDASSAHFAASVTCLVLFAMAGVALTALSLLLLGNHGPIVPSSYAKGTYFMSFWGYRPLRSEVIEREAALVEKADDDGLRVQLRPTHLPNLVGNSSAQDAAAADFSDSDNKDKNSLMAKQWDAFEHQLRDGSKPSIDGESCLAEDEADEGITMPLPAYMIRTTGSQLTLRDRYLRAAIEEKKAKPDKKSRASS